jgi:hypothetical protein
MTMEISPVPLFDFNWNDFSHCDEINASLDILNQNDNVNAQLDQLMNLNFLSDLDPDSRGSLAEDGSSALCPPNSISRIPTSHDIPIKGGHSFPPPSNYTWKKLLDNRWLEINLQLQVCLCRGWCWVLNFGVDLGFGVSITAGECGEFIC